MEVGLLTPAQQEQMVDLLLALHDHYHPGRVLDRGLVRNHLLDNLCGPHSQIRLVTAELGGELLALPTFTWCIRWWSLSPPTSGSVYSKSWLFLRTIGAKVLAWL